MTPRIWTVAVPQPPVAVNELAALREEVAHLRIRLAAAESAAKQWQQIHEDSQAQWRATYVRDTAILRAALMDQHEAIVIDRDEPEKHALAGMVRQ
jgi:hypothetical protein